MEQQNIDWNHIANNLPFGPDPQSQAQRANMWQYIDLNGNGFCSLAELDKGIRDILKIQSIFSCKPVIMRAFQAAKNSGRSKSHHGPNYIERDEFRIFLQYLRQFFEYYQAFARVDTGDDNRVSLQEFVQAMPMIQRWVGPIYDPVSEFRSIDRNNGDQILFDEFLAWASHRRLDLEDDDNLL